MSFLLIAAGMAIGFAYVLVRWFRDAMDPVVALLVAVRPLLIPLLVLAAAATVNLPLWVQVITAILLVIVVHRVIVRPELTRSSRQLGKWWHAIEHGAANAVRKFAAAGAPAVALAWILFGVVRPGEGFLAGQGGFPAAALLIALVALVAALAARLVAYATTPPRGAVSVLLGLAVLSGLMAAGVLPGYDPAVTGTVVLAVAAGVALVFAVVFERLRGADPAPADVARTERFHGLGLSLAMLSGVLLVAASASSLLVLDHPGSRQLAADRGAHATLYTRGSNSLKYRYAPVLAFTHDEKWAPTYVDSYVDSASARVVRRDGSEASPGHYKCSSLGPRSCLRITIDCASAADACSQALPQHDYGEHESSGAVYVRTLRRPGEDDPSDDAVALRGVFRSANDVARRTDILLQYWLFYPYDEWTTKVLGARLIQRHEGDWEAVTVGLDSNEKPLFVAYSAHCGGTWKRWKDTERFASHPLVAVAEGSHANYADSGAKRPPDFTSCKRLPRGIGTLLGFAANVRDVTSDDWQWGAAEVIRVTAKDWPMNFPGTWGGHDITQLTNARTFTSPLGGGPPSPPLQHLWQEPVKTIFCDRYWDGPEPCRER